MATLFAQSIIQFAPLRIFARMHTNTQHARLIRELFPKALFDEQNASYKLFIEIAWSFLLKPINFNDGKGWYANIDQKHRIGGLPAIIRADVLQEWLKNGIYHRDDKDPQTGLTLPAIIHNDGSQVWYKYGRYHRDDKDPRTGLTLPARIWINGLRYWYKDGEMHRDEKDPQTGLTLPAVIYGDGSQVWYKNDKPHRDDKDPQTGLTLPAMIRADGLQFWYKDGLLLHYWDR